MNAEIQLMLDLQTLHAENRAAEAALKEGSARIAALKNEIVAAEKRIAERRAALLAGRAELKDRELSLSDIDARIKKLAARRETLGSPKEIAAVEHELDAVKQSMGEVEEALIALIDTIAAQEKALAADETALSELRARMEAQTAEEQGRGVKLAAEIATNRQRYAERITGLPGQFRARFEKLLSSKTGVAIAPMHGDVCGACNFRIASVKRHEACSGDAAVVCTNCGCFVYGEQ
jgi:uncharacterized protein